MLAVGIKCDIVATGSSGEPALPVAGCSEQERHSGLVVISPDGTVGFLHQEVEPALYTDEALVYTVGIGGEQGHSCGSRILVEYVGKAHIQLIRGDGYCFYVAISRIDVVTRRSFQAEVEFCGHIGFHSQIISDNVQFGTVVSLRKGGFGRLYDSTREVFAQRDLHGGFQQISRFKVRIADSQCTVCPCQR